jgi:hypothetical protein
MLVLTVKFVLMLKFGGKVVRQKLSPSDSMNEKSQSTQERLDSEKRKSNGNHKKGTAQLRSMEEQEGNRVN